MKRSSLFYKYNRWIENAVNYECSDDVFERKNQTVCQAIKNVFLNTLKGTGLLFVFGIVIGGISGLLLAPFVFLLLGWSYPITLLVISMILWIFAGFILKDILIQQLKDTGKYPWLLKEIIPKNKIKESNEFSIIREGWYSFKNKVCVKIDYKD